MRRLVFLVFFVLLGSALFLEFKRLTIKPWPATHYEDVDDHFKYGSIGAEVSGIPYVIWRELPTIFADEIPGGFASFGFITEEGQDLPIGVSVRQIGVDRVGFNCATCHVSTYSIDGERHIVMGAPANALDLQAYLVFLSNALTDERLSADAVIDAARANDRELGFVDRFVLRQIIFPRLDEEASNLATSFDWMEGRAPHGPGRTDAGNFWRQRWGLEPASDNKVGTVDHPSVWGQDLRLDGWFHWDGNNRSINERNLSAALAGGAQEPLIERHAIERVSDWLEVLRPPQYPLPLDPVLVSRGRAVFEQEDCQTCHDPGAKKLGQVTPLDFVGTDPQRSDLFDKEMVRNFRSVGKAYSWRFSNYTSTVGYANMPLDGIWMRAPYLHNGSVPTLADLLSPPAERPATFSRGCTEFDPEQIGFVCSDGFQFDTSLIGNSNSGHEFGTTLIADDKAALLEYLRSL